MSFVELAGRLIGAPLSFAVEPITQELRIFQLEKQFPFLRDLSPQARRCALTSLTNTPAELPYFTQAINALFATNAGNDMTTVRDDLTRAGCTNEFEFVSCRRVLDLMTAVAQEHHRHQFRRPMGALFARMPVTTFDPEVIRKAGIERSPAGLSITSENPHGWFLCEGAESFLLDAIRTRHFAIINDSLFVKQDPHGHLAALCIQSLAYADGKACYEGNWYCPADPNTRASIKKWAQQSKKGENLDTGSWVHIRELRNDTETGKSSEQILRMAQALA